MVGVIGDLLDEWAPKGEFDFAEFAAFFPITVMFGLLGVSSQPVARIRHAIEAHVATLAIDLSSKPAMLIAWEELWQFADTLILEREASGEVDEQSLLDALIVRCETMGLRQMVAVIGDAENVGSIALHRTRGFAEAGHQSAFAASSTASA